MVFRVFGMFCGGEAMVMMRRATVTFRMANVFDTRRLTDIRRDRSDCKYARECQNKNFHRVRKQYIAERATGLDRNSEPSASVSTDVVRVRLLARLLSP